MSRDRSHSPRPTRPPLVLKNVLIIDGAYLQIGMNQLNQNNNYFLPLDHSGNFLVLITFLETIAKTKFDQIRFVTAEDAETRPRNQRLYEAINKARSEKTIIVDERDFKYRTQTCRCGCKQEVKWKVQAEVDVAIAVYLIDYALYSQVETITLFAGDRDFVDSINYVQSRLFKTVTIMGFEESTGPKIKSFDRFIDVTDSIVRLQGERLRRIKALKNSRSQTPERRNNPEERKYHVKIGDMKAVSQRIDHSALLAFGTKQDPSKDIEVQKILRLSLPREQEMVKGKFFKESLFPGETLKALISHPAVSPFDAEHALFTVDNDLKAAFEFLFNSHPMLL